MIRALEMSAAGASKTGISVREMVWMLYTLETKKNYIKQYDDKNSKKGNTYYKIKKLELLTNDT